MAVQAWHLGTSQPKPSTTVSPAFALVGIFVAAGILPTAVAGVVDNVGDYRAVIFFQKGMPGGEDASLAAIQRTAGAMRETLVKAGWADQNIADVPLNGITGSHRRESQGGLMSRQANLWLGPPHIQNSLKLVYYVGHGGTWGAECPNNVGLIDENGNYDERIAPIYCDDEFTQMENQMLTGVQGPLVIIWDTCLGGGMFDGDADLHPANSFSIGSATSTTFAWYNPNDVSNFMRSFVDGMHNGGADQNPNDGNVSLGELRDYLSAQLPGYTRPQTPSFLRNVTNDWDWGDLTLGREVPGAPPVPARPVVAPRPGAEPAVLCVGGCLPPDASSEERVVCVRA